MNVLNPFRACVQNICDYQSRNRFNQTVNNFVDVLTFVSPDAHQSKTYNDFQDEFCKVFEGLQNSRNESKAIFWDNLMFLFDLGLEAVKSSAYYKNHTSAAELLDVALQEMKEAWGNLSENSQDQIDTNGVRIKYCGFLTAHDFASGLFCSENPQSLRDLIQRSRNNGADMVITTAPLI